MYKTSLLQIRPRYTPNDVTGHVPENILWFLSAQSSTPGLPQLQAINATFDPLWAAIYKAYASANNFYTGSVVTDWSSNTGLQYSSVGVFTPVAGTVGGTSHSGQVALLISFQIGVRYKGGHPRCYLPQPSVGATQGVSNDEVTTAVQTNVLTAYNAMIGGMKNNATLGGQTQVIYRHRTDPVNAATFQFASLTVQNQTATQRRRVRRVPHH